MSNPILSQIEDSFNQLSISEQLWLIKCLVHRVHETMLNNKNNLDEQLALMAADPEIQSELLQLRKAS
jgi:hypothetical protein